MLHVCCYFQVHQPFRLRRYQFFDIGLSDAYFDEEKNKAIFEKVAHKCYLPTNKILLDLIRAIPDFNIAFSFSGVFLEQCQQYMPEVLESFQRLVATGNVEILAETYHHSLACMYQPDEFVAQITLHEEAVKALFGKKPTIFRNTELIYNNDIGSLVQNLGYRAMLAEGAEKILGWRSPAFVYAHKDGKLPLLLKNYRLSDDIAFRFSERAWKEYPLTAEKFARWVNAYHGTGQTVNLFMDYETFGEHQWQESGIFAFLEHMPRELLKHPDTIFSLPSEVINACSTQDILDVPDYLSWADIERDVSAWVGNELQTAALQELYNLKETIMRKGDENLLKKWRLLQTSDHFYYMCIKWFNDGDVHKYFNPYQDPYEGFIYFMNVIQDLKKRIA